MSPSAPKRVAYVLPHAQLGGAEIATLRMMEAHDRSRYVPVGLLFEDGSAARHLDHVGIEHAVAPLRPRMSQRRDRAAARAWLEEQLTSQQIDLQHSVMAWTQWLAGPAAHSLGIPATWFQHNRATWRSATEWLAASSFYRVLFVNSQFTLRAQERLNPKRRRLELVYPPVEAPRVANGDQFRHELGVSDRTTLVAVCGRLLHSKGQDMALKALSLAEGDLHLAFVGDTAFGVEPHYRTELQTMADSLGIEERVHFVGFRNNLGEVYAGSDILLHTSRLQETYGLVVAEAKAFGCTVVATNSGAIPELIRDGTNGVLFEPDDHAGLGRILTRLAADPDLRARLGSTAREEPIVTADQSARRLEEIYDRVLSE